MSVASLWGQIKLASGMGILNGLESRLAFAQNMYFVGSNAPTFVQQKNTIADALSSVIDGDVIVLGPQGFTEGNLVLPEGTDNITIIGMGGRGACYIEPSTAGDEGLQVLGDDCTLINVGVADGGSGDYGLCVGSNTVSPSRFRAYGCKFEGSAIGCKLWQPGDVLLDDCEFAWANTGLQFSSGAIGFCTQIMVQRSKFHNNATVCVGEAAAAQQVNDLFFINNVLNQLEDGTEPTDFIVLSDNGNTGLIAGNQIAIATNAIAKLVIGTGLMWVANMTEAGVSTARPS